MGPMSKHEIHLYFTCTFENSLKVILYDIFSVPVLTVVCQLLCEVGCGIFHLLCYAGTKGVSKIVTVKSSYFQVSKMIHLCNETIGSK